MRVLLCVLMAAALALPALSSPAGADTTETKRIKEEQAAAELRRKRQEENDRAYRATTQRIQAKDQKPKDPWASMR